jgi:hypothetical protein
MPSLALAWMALAAVLPADLYPTASYDPAIPTLTQVVGHAPGERITSPEQITRYLEALHAAAPERTRLIEYARSWEGRPLHVLLLGSAERLARLDETRRDLGRLADARLAGPDERERLAAGLPVVVWLMHAVHGNELSSCDAALASAYHLLAARDDPSAERVRREALVLLDPLQNPDGRARFLAQNALAMGPTPGGEPYAAEHDEPWPGGRANHYLFDMNRDWFALSQPETRGRIALFRQWWPQVVVDLHEMGGDSSYYFPPPAEPVNPHVSTSQRRWLERFGRALAAEFDARGFAYFTREVYDSFYPGYGESWPLFNGAIGMTFEQASPRGLLWQRRDGDLLTYRDAVRQHLAATWATLDTAARQRVELLRAFAEHRQAALQAGASGAVRAYVLVPDADDPARAARLAELLAAQGIEVGRTLEALNLPAPSASPRDGPRSARTLAPGAYVVSLAQPAGWLARNLLDPRTPLDEAFVAEQNRRRLKRLPDQIYDVTAWSLPLAFDVECLPWGQTPGVRTTPVNDDERRDVAQAPPLPPAAVAYLMPWGTGAARAVAEGLRSGLRVRVATRPFGLAGRRFGVGTAIWRVAENPPDLRARLSALAWRWRAVAVATDTGFVDEGISLGSGDVLALRAPRVLLAWDAPTQSLSAGAARFALEQRAGLAVTVVRAANLRRVEFERHDVLVLPSGNYADVVKGALLKRIEEWVRQGGTLVALGDATRWLTGKSVGLLSTHAEQRDGSPDVDQDEEKEGDKKDAPKAAAPVVPLDLPKALQPESEDPEDITGALLRVRLDREHWLSAGTDGEIQAVISGRRVFTPLKLDKGRNVGLYDGADTVASGLVWPEASRLLANKAYLMEQRLGRGQVVAFAEDPNFRAYTAATELLFLNAVLLGPAR